MYIKSMDIYHYGFVCPVSFFMTKKYIGVKKKNFLEKNREKKYISGNLKVLDFTNYSYSYSYRSWLRKSIPIPFCRKNNY